MLALGIIGTTYGIMSAQRERRAAEAALAMVNQQRARAETERQRAQATANFLTQMLQSVDPQARRSDALARAGAQHRKFPMKPGMTTTSARNRL